MHLKLKSKTSIAVKRRRTSDSDDSLMIISEDQTFQRMQRRLQRIKQQTDIADLTREIYSLQTSRAVSALKTKAILRDSLRVIVDSSVDEIATRSRASTIKLSAMHSLMMIEDILSHLSKYLLSKYAKQMKAQGQTTITAQKAYLDVHLHEFIETKRSLDYLIRMVDIVLEDCDQTSYGLRRVQDAIEQSNKDR